MNTMALVVVLGVLVVGVLLMWVGWRGRRLNRHPMCRDCGFDLDGAYPAVVTCPECGAGLRRARGVRVGARRRMMSLVAVGGLMVVLALAPLGATIYATMTGANINPSKPTWLLLVESKWVNGNAGDLVANELLDRMVTKKIAVAGYGPLVEAALARQADQSLNWCDAWGDIVERASMDGTITAEQRASFEQNAVVLGLESRAKVVRGEPLPLFVSRVSQRVTTNTNAYAQVWVRTVKLDGVGLKRMVPTASYPGFTRAVTDQIRKSVAMQPIGYVQVYGAAAGQWAARMGIGTAAMGAMVPRDAKLGPGVVEVEVGYTAEVLAGNPRAPNFGMMSAVMRGLAVGSSGMVGNVAEVLGRQKVTLRVPVEIVDEGPGVGVTVMEADEKTSERMAIVLRPGTVNAQPMNWGAGGTKPWSWITLQLNLEKDGPALAHTAIVRVAGKTYPAGEVVSEAHAGSVAANVFVVDAGQRSLSVQVAKDLNDLPPTIDLILKPKPELARLTRLMTKVYGGTIEIKNIGVTLYDPQGTAVKRKTAKKTKAEEEAKEKDKDKAKGETKGQDEDKEEVKPDGGEPTEKEGEKPAGEPKKS